MTFVPPRRAGAGVEVKGEALPKEKCGAKRSTLEFVFRVGHAKSDEGPGTAPRDHANAHVVYAHVHVHDLRKRRGSAVTDGLLALDPGFRRGDVCIHTCARAHVFHAHTHVVHAHVHVVRLGPIGGRWRVGPGFRRGDGVSLLPQPYIVRVNVRVSVSVDVNVSVSVSVNVVHAHRHARGPHDVPQARARLPGCSLY